MTIKNKVKVWRIAVGAILAALVIAGGFHLDSFAAQDQKQEPKKHQGRRSAPIQSEETETAKTAAAVSQSAEVVIENPGNQRNFSSPLLGTRFIQFDVSENAKRFVFDETPLFADGSPAYGNEFVTEGYIYPFGTLDNADGVNADGSPQFPDKVIGRWICRGWHVGEGAKTVTGPWVVTNQVYDFGAKHGQSSFMTDGVELVDIDVPINRAISGGTGSFAESRGEATQTMIGFNQLNGVKLRFTVRVVNRR